MSFSRETSIVSVLYNMDLYFKMKLRLPMKLLNIPLKYNTRFSFLEKWRGESLYLQKCTVEDFKNVKKKSYLSLTGH